MDNIINYENSKYLQIEDAHKLNLNIEEIFAYKIDTYLKELFKENYEELKKSMISCQAVISGSFVLQVLLSEKYQWSDIDFLLIKNTIRKITLINS